MRDGVRDRVGAEDRSGLPLHGSVLAGTHSENTLCTWQVQAAWQQLLTAAAGDSNLRDRSTFQYDVVNVGRQVRTACGRFSHPCRHHASSCFM